MQLDWGRFRARAGAVIEGARALGVAAVLSGLAVALAAQAAGARRERESVAREGTALDREIARLRHSNESLRGEIRALESDPVYVESLLRRWKMIGASERNVE